MEVCIGILYPGSGHLFERTFVRIAEKSNKCPFEQMSSNFFGNFLKSSDRSNWPIETVDHSLESLLQINMDGIRTQSQVERELTEKLCRKLHLIPK